ncbi:MAG: hypothetical protein II135_12075 [Clostridia bacterium]|nr:hypothetical protein [Clostridia bacterium]
MKRIVCFILVLMTVLSLAACSGVEAPSTEQLTAPAAETNAVTENTETGAVTEPFTDEEPVFYQPKEKEQTDPDGYDFSNTDWTGTVAYSNAGKNAIQGGYTDKARKGFTFSNQNMSMTYDILASEKMYVRAFESKSGTPYFLNTMDAFIETDDGITYLGSESIHSGRINIHRLGYYYYDVTARDQQLIAGSSREPLKDGEKYYDVLEAFGDSVKGKSVKGVEYNNGALSFSLGSISDSSITFSGLEFDPQEFDAVQITLKTTYSDIAHLFVLPKGKKSYSANQQLTFRYEPGEWYTVVVPFRAMADFSASSYTDLMICPLTTVRNDKVEIKEVKLVKRGEAVLPFRLERVFHTYPDKLHESTRIVAQSDIKKISGYTGVMIKIPAETVRAAVFKNDKGESSTIEGFDFHNVEYVGFDIKGAGVFGLIMPTGNEAVVGTVIVTLENGYYVIKRKVELDEMYNNGESTGVYHRIYTTDSHQFNGLRKAAYEERNPLKDLQTVGRQYGARYLGYDKQRGCYRFNMSGSGFVDAYYDHPDEHKNIVAVVGGDGVVDRNIYINAYTQSGALESAVLLDQNDRLLPVPVQVSKNFGGEYEERNLGYDPNDAGYGEAIFPISVKADQSMKLRVIHLYQNWGNFPLKQLSSVSFINPYYHLSVGVSETNCIAPYYVYGKDAWTLPDFRANSAPLWASQPQHTSGGRLYFLQYEDENGNSYMSESTYAGIDSAGPVYADIKMDYISDDGKIKAEYRHLELPQTDENRTYYQIKLTVLEDVSFKDFKNDFSFFSCDGRFPKYSKLGYLDENNEMTITAANGKKTVKNIVLGKEYPYFDVFKPNGEDCINLAAIIRSSDITIGGKKFDGNFVLCDSYYGDLNHLRLSLDLGETTLRKGDVIAVDMILLPWGYSNSDNDDNVRNVREDSCIRPYTLEVIKGTKTDDAYVPKLRAENSEAEFTLSGGKNNAVVRVYGFEKPDFPEIKLIRNGAEEPFNVHKAADYDGYQVYYDEDGTYSFAFAVDTDGSDTYHFIIIQK